MPSPKILVRQLTRSMSSVCHRLHGLFTTSALPRQSQRNPVASPLKGSKTSSYRQSLVYQVAQERDLTKVVQNFKASSESNWFRGKHSIYHVTVLRLASARHFSQVEEIIEHQKNYEDITDEGFVARLIWLYGKAGMFDHAQKLFDEMPQLKCERTVLSFNALLGACVSSKNFEEVKEVFGSVSSMLNIKPDVVSYNTLLTALCKTNSVDNAVLIIDEMERKGVNPDVVTYNILLNTFMESGRFLDGDNVWSLMQSKGVSPCILSYRAKLQGLMSQNKVQQAMELMDELGDKGLKPDASTYNALIRGCCLAKNLEEAKKWYLKLMESERFPTEATCEVLVPLACENGDLEFALNLCQVLIARQWKRTLTEPVLQGMVESLVKASETEKAKELVVLVNSSGYLGFDMKFPSET